MAKMYKSTRARAARKLIRAVRGLVPREGWQAWYDLNDQTRALAIGGVRYRNQRKFRAMLKVHERRVNRRRQETQARAAVAMQVLSDPAFAATARNERTLSEESIATLRLCGPIDRSRIKLRAIDPETQTEQRLHETLTGLRLTPETKD